MKRKIEEASTEEARDPRTCTPCDEKSECPSYGSQNYWDERYKKNYSSDTKDKDESKGKNGNKDDTADEEASPGFAWYFSYDELKPLLLPLVLGRDEAEEEWSDCDDEMEEILEGDDDEVDAADGKSDEEVDEDEDDDESDQEIFQEEEDEEVEEDGNDAEETPQQENEFADFELDPNRSPRSVLEIGCGDAPLGEELCKNMHEIEAKTKIDAKKIAERIICFDYSKSCIDLLEKHQKTQKSENGLQVDYKVHDARDLPYNDKEFDVIIDKGTLDAMLSDKAQGTKNCVKIISEAARTLAIDGYILIVSHLNANGPEGLSWVNEVLITGLKDGDGECSWRIEVHGNDAQERDDEGEGMKVKETTEDEEESKNYGPAVYIIRKVDMKGNGEKSSEDDFQRADVKFFGY